MSMTTILQCKQRIDALARSLIGQPAFGEIHVLIPDSSSPETGFIRATSWLYCLYFESGAVSLTFLRSAGNGSNNFNRIAVDKHVESVRCLRTELHHNLGFQDSDQRARLAAESWRRIACGTVLPLNDKQWSNCYETLINEAKGVLCDIEAVVRDIEANQEERQDLLDDWHRRLNRTVSAAEFDLIIEDVKLRMGREQLATVNFRNRHLGRWRKELDILEDGYDFEREACLLIEKTLLDDGSGVLPITGKDIIDSLSINPGPQVGTLLQEARSYYLVNVCPKEELLEFLKSKFKAEKSE